MKLFQMFHVGGAAMYILLFCSIISLTVIIERVIYFKRKSKVKRAKCMHDIMKELEKGNVKHALEICKSADTPFAKVVYAGLNLYDQDEKKISNGMERQIAIETTLLERYTSIEGTIGSTAVYIGLFGTVLGIMRAFNDIAQTGSGGINVVIAGISQALGCTAAGLLVAVPAVIAYNYFVKKIEDFVMEMELSASEFLDAVARKKK